MILFDVTVRICTTKEQASGPCLSNESDKNDALIVALIRLSAQKNWKQLTVMVPSWDFISKKKTN